MRSMRPRVVFRCRTCPACTRSIRVALRVFDYTPAYRTFLLQTLCLGRTSKSWVTSPHRRLVGPFWFFKPSLAQRQLEQILLPRLPCCEYELDKLLASDWAIGDSFNLR